MTANSDTPRTDEVPDWNARCNTADDNQIITNAFLLAHAHDESEELRILSRQLERELSEARAKLQHKDKLRDSMSVAQDILHAENIKQRERAEREGVRPEFAKPGIGDAHGRFLARRRGPAIDRAPGKLVGREGFEPSTNGLRARC